MISLVERVDRSLVTTGSFTTRVFFPFFLCFSPVGILFPFFWSRDFMGWFQLPSPALLHVLCCDAVAFFHLRGYNPSYWFNLIGDEA